MRVHRHGDRLRPYRLVMAFLIAILTLLLPAAPALASSSITLHPGWNLVAGGADTAFPAVLFGWNGSSYMSTTSPTSWQGYWCKVAEEQSVTLSAVSGPHAATLTDGWNLIGNPMSSSATLSLPQDRAAFVYNASAGTYMSATALAPGQGAWVKGSAGETVTLAAVPPTITALAPADGLVAGGTTVTITGTGLTDATAVNFGGTSASSFIVDSDTTITAVAPATALELGKSCRTVGVSVATAGGTSTDTSADDYLYYTLTVTSGSTTQTYSLSDIKARASVSGYWGPHRDYGVNNYYTGTPLLALLADVGGLPIGKGLRITSSDGFVADYDAARLAAMTSGTYQMWYPATSPLMVDDIETAGSVEMIAAYQMDGSPLTLDQAAEGAGPIRVVLIRSIADVLTEGKYAPYIVKSIVVR